MLCLTLRVETPSLGWCRALSLKKPDLHMRIVSCFPLAEGAMEETVKVEGPLWQESLDDIRNHPGVDRVDILSSMPTSGTLRVRLQGCPFPRMFAQSGIVPTFPIKIQSGVEEWIVIAHEGEARSLLASLEAEGIRAEVARSGQYEPRDVLTARQREVLDRAVLEGYYSYPRRITLTRLAEKLGIAKSTLSETLMVVERRLLGPPPGRDERPSSNGYATSRSGSPPIKT